jgi:hypothetical protein
MVDGEQGKKLEEKVWQEMVEVFQKQAPGIKGIISAA